jgi:hypothetical protein
MLILNFTHPLTNEQRAQIEVLANTPYTGPRNLDTERG